MLFNQLQVQRLVCIAIAPWTGSEATASLV